LAPPQTAVAIGMIPSIGSTRVRESTRLLLGAWSTKPEYESFSAIVDSGYQNLFCGGRSRRQFGKLYDRVDQD
jgi:hypothetical protein